MKEKPVFEVLDSKRDPARVRLVGELDLHTAEEAARAILPKCQGDSLTIDLSEVTFMDSSGLRVLLEAFKEVSSRGGEFSLIAPTPAVKRVIDLVGLTANGVIIHDAEQAGGG